MVLIGVKNQTILPQMNKGIFLYFCGLFRKPELYLITTPLTRFLASFPHKGISKISRVTTFRVVCCPSSAVGCVVNTRSGVRTLNGKNRGLGLIYPNTAWVCERTTKCIFTGCFIETTGFRREIL